MFDDSFLDALGCWQRGWRQDPTRKAPIGKTLAAEAAKLPDRFRRPRPAPLYRKRHLYRREDQRELVPLFLGGVLAEDGTTSWSLDLDFAERFDGILDETDARAVAGAVFRHIAAPTEIVLDVPALWGDREFVEAAESCRDRHGAEARAIFHFRGERVQNEVILTAPLRRDEIFKFSGKGDFDGICREMGATTDEQREAVAAMLRTAGEVPERPRFLDAEATQRATQRTVAAMQARIAELVARGVLPEAPP